MYPPYSFAVLKLYMSLGDHIDIKIPKAELEIWWKAKANRTWKEILEIGLFGDHKPIDLVSYAEMEALIDQKLTEFREELKK